MTYALLKTQVADYLHRSDLTNAIPTFIAIAESTLFRELDIKGTEVSVTGTTTGSYITLPTDFKSVSKLSMSYQGSTRLLDYAPQSYIPADTPMPSYYALENGKIIVYGASTGTAYTLYYTPRIAPLSDVAPTNWLLDNARDLYIYASALEGAKNIRDDNEVQKLQSMVVPLLDSVRRLSERTGQPSNGGLQIKRRT
jgi:hypothetical protein